MNVSKSRRLKVNLGNYESYEFSAQATLTHDDLGFTQDEVVADITKVTNALNEEIENILDVLLVDDIQSSADITEEARSVVLRAFNPPKPQASPAAKKPGRTPRGR